MSGTTSSASHLSPASPVEAARAWRTRTGVVFLDTDPQSAGGLSILAAEPSEILVGNLLRDAARLRTVIEAHRRAWAPDANGPSGGLFGWVSYEGDYVFGVYPECHVFAHETGAWQNVPGVLPAREEFQAAANDAALVFVPRMDRDTFCRTVEQAQAYISAGDIYQVNLSYPWLAGWPAGLEPWAYYERLRNVSPAPYGAFLDLHGMQVMSSSPECFLKMSGQHVLTRPIKGTRPRGVSREGDLHLASELLESTKERAELVMITDLERNDLGQVCKFGSVEVTQLLRLEAYAQVHHLVSTVEGVLKPEVDHLAALMACFPGGSITGAPKKRSTEIIRELEPFARGLYTGAIGYLGFNGESQFSIAIRTAVRQAEQASFHTGAGIVADSVPAKEWEETLHKAAGLLNAARKSGR